MSKIQNSVLDRVSENNNDYRLELRTLNTLLDERTTSLVSEIVTASNYTLDFSLASISAKDTLANKIARVVESYVIKDLRSVETVNEQFVEKINDKLDTANIESELEKQTFIENLNKLLNDKYLEIVKIKRIEFIDDKGTNGEVEEIINTYVSELKNNSNFEEDKLQSAIATYKSDIYSNIKTSLEKISNLYLNNFVNEVKDALNKAVENDSVASFDEAPVIPEIPKVSDIPEIPAIPVIEEIPEIPVVEEEIPEIPTIPEVDDTMEEVIVENDIEEIPVIPEIPEVNDIPTSANEIPVIPVIEETPEIPSIPVEDVSVEAMEIPAIEPVVVETPKDVLPKKSYDVEEILKIAKSPIVTMEEPKKEDDYVSVKPISSSFNSETIEAEFNERQIIEELIKRLTTRLNNIDERIKKYEAEKVQVDEDANFVNDLIASADKKKLELDQFETELNEKEALLKEKKKELDKKINDIMPFANAVLKQEEES